MIMNGYGHVTHLGEEMYHLTLTKPSPKLITCIYFPFISFYLLCILTPSSHFQFAPSTSLSLTMHWATAPPQAHLTLAPPITWHLLCRPLHLYSHRPLKLLHLKSRTVIDTILNKAPHVCTTGVFTETHTRIHTSSSSFLFPLHSPCPSICAVC